MNFKILFFLLIITTFAGCGVKGPPLKYAETSVDSYIHSYTGAEPTPEEIERTKSKQAIPSASGPEPINTDLQAPVKP